MKSILFWCGNIVLLNKLQSEYDTTSFNLNLISEDIDGCNYTYKVQVNSVSYYYRFTINSNTRLEGSFFIESPTLKSQIYTVEKECDVIQVSETSVDFRDLYFVNDNNIIDVYIRSGTKTAISTIDVTESFGSYKVNFVNLPISKNAREYTKDVIVGLFAVAGVTDKVICATRDVVSYTGRKMSMTAYSDQDSQVIALTTLENEYFLTIKCFNSFFCQRYEIKKLSSAMYHVTEIVDAMKGTIIKRQYTISVSSSTIVNTETKKIYSYEIDGNDIVFRKR